MYHKLDYMSLVLHKEINDKLDYFLNADKIPNIIFHGPNGSGKRTLVTNFIEKIYNNDKEVIKTYVMNVNCAHGKGIKFVREELKFFAKTHINFKGTGHFKTIIMSNADKLTIDAQSALRRCIELFSHTTRFFIIVEDRYKLLRPILSRFCEIFIPEPIINKNKVNLHKYVLNECFVGEDDNKKQSWLKKYIEKIKICSYKELLKASIVLYEKGYCGLDIMKYIENSNINMEKRYQLLLAFHKVKKEFRNEKFLILYMLNFVLLRSDINLENMSFM